ncbi:MAG: CPBP family intramembrane metalloprotease [Deltaproteobacteria bacterium]|nr:CPBP family intramembrane metalloprotease [Deltaproteobacteria bacterium]
MAKPSTTFSWERAIPLSVPWLLVATFGPSAVAFAGFHGVLPWLVTGGMPPVLAWPLVAGVALTGFGLFGGWVLARDARLHGVSLRARLCLNPLSGRQWGLVGLIIVGMIAVMMGIMQLLPGWLAQIGFVIPDYMPFFLKGLNPATTPPEILSPGYSLKGAYWMLFGMAYVLTLNILVEDLYFRAWMLPRMGWMGKWAWVVNGTLFAFYHTFQLWLLPVLLLGSLGFAFIVWKTRSVIPSLVAHLLLNLMNLVGMFTLIF